MVDERNRQTDQSNTKIDDAIADHTISIKQRRQGYYFGRPHQAKKHGH